MAANVEDYVDEWRATLEDPDKLRRFAAFVDAPATGDPDLTTEHAYVIERGQHRPATPTERGRDERGRDERGRDERGRAERGRDRDGHMDETGLGQAGSITPNNSTEPTWTTTRADAVLIAGPRLEVNTR